MADVNVEYFDVASPVEVAAFADDSERRLLAEITRRLRSRASTEALVDFLFESTHSISPCDRVSVAFVEERGGRLVAHYTRSSYQPTKLNRGYAEDLAGTALQEIVTQGRVRIIHDLEAYFADHPQSRSTKLLLEEGVRSNLTVPLKIDDVVVGVLFRSSRLPNVYRPQHAFLHAAIAEQLSPAIEKTYRIERLEQANHAYTELLTFVSHELKSPIASLMTTAQLMRDGYLGDLNDKQTDAIRRMVAKGKYVLDLVRDYLELARIEQGEIALNRQQGVDLDHDIIQPAFEVIQPQLQSKQMTLAIDMPDAFPVLEVDPGLLRVVLINLLGNAVRYGFEGGHIDLRAAKTARGFRVIVRNTGVGFSAEERPRLFRKFSRLQHAPVGDRGTGVGLYTVWRLVHLHHGTIDATSQPGEWAEFTFEIPQSLTNHHSGGMPDASDQTIDN